MSLTTSLVVVLAETHRTPHLTPPDFRPRPLAPNKQVWIPSPTKPWFYLVALEDDLYPEERVGAGLAVSVDGAGELLQGPLDVQSEGLLHHPVHLLRVTHPVVLNLKTTQNRQVYTLCSVKWLVA